MKKTKNPKLKVHRVKFIIEDKTITIQSSRRVPDDTVGYLKSYSAQISAILAASGNSILISVVDRR